MLRNLRSILPDCIGDTAPELWLQKQQCAILIIIFGLDKTVGNVDGVGWSRHGRQYIIAAVSSSTFDSRVDWERDIGAYDTDRYVGERAVVA